MTPEELYNQRKKVLYERIITGFYNTEEAAEKPFQEIQILEQFIFYLNNQEKAKSTYLNSFYKGKTEI